MSHHLFSAARSHGAPPVVLVAGGAADHRHAISVALEEGGATVFEAATGAQALAVAAVRQPSAIVLDAALPDMDLETACRELRAWSNASLVVLAGEDATVADGEPTTPGADDWFPRSVAVETLAARIWASVRRAVGASGLAVLRIGDLVLDFDRRIATRAGRVLGVTRIEWEILRTLAAHAGSTLTHQEIFDEVWAQPFGNAADSVRVHVYNLRRKIERVASRPEIIRTGRRDGYRFEVPRLG